jgi:hypothetical protein
MPTELEELVGFIGHPNPQIRLAAVENLVPFSTSQPALFKADGLRPVRNLKLLVRDHPRISTHATHMLVNLSADAEVRDDLVADDKFLDLVLARIVAPEEPNAAFLTMLLANLAKSDKLHATLLERRQPPPEKLESDELVINQLLDLFVRGADKNYNKDADFDHLAYLFADLTQHEGVRRHLVSPPAQGSNADADADARPIPLAKIKVFTSHSSDIRRRGVASAIKNAAFDVSAHPSFLASATETPGGDAAVVDILPYVLLPIMGPETYDEDEMLDMLPEVQLLPPDKERERHADIIKTHVETLILLGSTREGRDRMREVNVYPIVREAHLKVSNEEVQDACERLVNLLKGKEEGEADDEEEEARRVVEFEADEDEENMLVEV